MHTWNCTHFHEAAQPSAAHAWLLSRGHADCMSYSSISMLLAWSCVYTTLFSLPSSTSPVCPPSQSSFLPPSLSLCLLGFGTPSIPDLALFYCKTEQIFSNLILSLNCIFLYSYSTSLYTSSLLGLPPSPRLCVTLGCAFGFLGLSGEQPAMLIILLGSSHIF